MEPRNENNIHDYGSCCLADKSKLVWLARGFKIILGAVILLQDPHQLSYRVEILGNTRWEYRDGALSSGSMLGRRSYDMEIQKHTKQEKKAGKVN